jgi:hypothetical protein
LIDKANIETLKTMITKQSVRQMVRRMKKKVKEKSAKRKQLHAATAVAAAPESLRMRRPSQ